MPGGHVRQMERCDEEFLRRLWREGPAGAARYCCSFVGYQTGMFSFLLLGFISGVVKSLEFWSYAFQMTHVSSQQPRDVFVRCAERSNHDAILRTLWQQGRRPFVRQRTGGADIARE